MRLPIVCTLLFGLFAANPSTAWADKSPLPVRSFPKSVLQGFEKKGISSAEFSAFALPIAPYVSRHPEAYAHQSTELFNPASVVKVFTTGLALHKLQSTYQFKTGFHAQAEPVNGVLNSPLYIKGGGDPSLLSSDLWVALRQLRGRGVSVINGPIVLDDSLFASLNPGLSPSLEEAFDEAPHRAYHAQPNALLLNFGAMAVDLTLNQDSVVIIPDEAPRDWAFVSEVRLVEGACGAWKNGISVGFNRVGSNVVVTFKGNYPRRCGQATLPIRVPVQDWLWESWVKEIWLQLGGRFSGEQAGRVIKGVTPSNTVALYTHAGRPVSELMRHVNKWSSNVMARHLEIAVSRTPESFNSEMKEWLRGQGIQVNDWFFENGSGLSRQTRVDAKGLAEFFRNMAGRADFPDYLASFPRAGADGTLQRRVTNVNGFAYLKTGSLNNVRSVGGYLRDSQGQLWAVVVLVRSARAQDSWAGMEGVMEFLYRPD